MTKEPLFEISRKLNVLISLLLRQILGQKEFSKNRNRSLGIGDLARYLHDMGLEAKDIAEILGSPIQSIRTLLTPKRRR